LAAEIRAGAWREKLPGERQLAGYFAVSRKTIRAALSILARANMLRLSGWQRIVTDSTKDNSIKRGRQTVVLITGNNEERSELASKLEHHLALSGYDLQVEMVPARGNARRWLEKLSDRRSASVWLLCSVSREVQSWFERRGLQALILGSRHKGIHLPDLDVNYRAVCRHAVHTLLRLGHRKIVFFSVDSGLAGDLESEFGFSEAFSKFEENPARGRIIRHKGSRMQIGRLLGHLFGGAGQPTAMIVARVCYMTAVTGYLMRMGLKIPANVSLICRDDDPLFEYFVPAPSCYHRDFDRFVRRAAQLAVRLDQGVSLRSSSLRLMPQFVAGETIAACRTS